MASLSALLSSKLKAEGIDDELTLIKIDYALTLLRNEGIKFILLIIFYSYFHLLNLFGFCAAILIPVRLFSGGMHMKTNVTCFIVSFSFFFLTICILPRASLANTGYYALLAIAFTLIALLSPIATSKRPIVTRKKFIHCRCKSIGLCLIACVILLLMRNHSMYFHCGVWALLLQSLQLTFAYVLFKRSGAKRYEQQGMTSN